MALPQANAKDLVELPQEVRGEIQYHLIDHVDDLLALALLDPLGVDELPKESGDVQADEADELQQVEVSADPSPSSPTSPAEEGVHDDAHHNSDHGEDQREVLSQSQEDANLTSEQSVHDKQLEGVVEDSDVTPEEPPEESETFM